MEPDRVLNGLTRLLHVASYMDKDKPLGLLCNNWTLGYLILAGVEFKSRDYLHCELKGVHTHIAQYLPNFTMGVAYLDTCKKVLDQHTNWYLSRDPFTKVTDTLLTAPNYHFLNNILYITIPEISKPDPAPHPTQLEFIENLT